MILHDTHSNEGVLQPVGAPVTNLATATFAKADNSMFLIKNDNDATVTLVVKYFKQSAFVTTTTGENIFAGLESRCNCCYPDKCFSFKPSLFIIRWAFS